MCESRCPPSSLKIVYPQLSCRHEPALNGLLRNCKTKGRPQTSCPLHKNRGQDLYPANHKPLEPFRPFVSGIRAGAECHGLPR